jgi:hypothetical protein
MLDIHHSVTLLKSPDGKRKNVNDCNKTAKIAIVQLDYGQFAEGERQQVLLKLNFDLAMGACILQNNLYVWTSLLGCGNQLPDHLCGGV